jgi:hypothetical protein
LHGNSGQRNLYISSLKKAAEPSVIEFLTNVSKLYGEAYTTQFVQEVTGMSLHKEEEGLIELPSSFTKRKLYTEYCFERGHKVKANAKGSYGKVSLYSPRPFDAVLWPQGSQPLPVCCWMDFLIIWKKELPYRLLDKIERSANCKSATNNNPSSSNEDEEKSITLSCFSSENDIDELQFLSTTEYPIETVLMDATEHTVHAQNQRLLADSQIDEAKATAALPWENRR